MMCCAVWWQALHGISNLNRTINTKPKFSWVHQGGKEVDLIESAHANITLLTNFNSFVLSLFFSLALWVLLTLCAEHHGVVLQTLLTGQNQAEATVSDVKLPVFMYSSQGCLAKISQVAASTWWAIRFLRLLDFTADKRLAVFHVTVKPCQALWLNLSANIPPPRSLKL